MKLTVGSLPAAVYWRRRAIVLAVPLLAIASVWVSCSRADKTTKGTAVASTKRTASPSSGVPQSPAAVPSSPLALSPTAPATTDPVPPAGGNEGAIVACLDSELLITPVAESETARRGQAMRLTIKIKNVSARTCPRDLGADAQELYLEQGGVKVYSSDACDPKTGNSVRSLSPGDVQAFYVSWDGTATAAGCSGRQAPAAGKYQLIGRLGAKLSEPVTITLI